MKTTDENHNMIQEIGSYLTRATLGETEDQYIMLSELTIPLHQLEHLLHITFIAEYELLGNQFNPKQHKYLCITTEEPCKKSPSGSAQDDIRAALAQMMEYYAELSSAAASGGDTRPSLARIAAMRTWLKVLHHHVHNAVHQDLSGTTTANDRDWMKPVKAMSPSRHYDPDRAIREIRKFLGGQPTITCVPKDNQYHIDHYLITRKKVTTKIPIDHWIIIVDDVIKAVSDKEVKEKYRLK